MNRHPNRDRARAAKQVPEGSQPAIESVASTVDRPALHASLVLVVLGAYTLALYWPSLACGVISDAWHLLYIGSRPLGEALSTRLDYHFIPGTHFLNAVLWRLLGLRDGLYQVVNLAEIWMVGAALYFVGRQLFSRASVALLAAVLFLANASFHEVPFWAGVGNFHSLAALLYLAGMAAALQAGRSLRPLPWSILFAACGLAAFFTYEPAFSLFPVGVLAAALARDVPPEERWRVWFRRGKWPLVAAAAAVVIVLAAKSRLAAAGDRALFLPETLNELAVRLLFVVREVIHVFTLRGDGAAVQRVVAAGTRSGFGQPLFHAILVGWLLLFAVIAAFLVVRGRPAMRLAALWFTVHIVLLAASIIPQSRHYFLAALPAALLSAGLLWTGAERAAAWLGRRSTADWSAQPAFLVLLVLLLVLPGAKRDLDHAAVLYGQATAATRQVRAAVQQRLAHRPALSSVVLLNLPSQLAQDGIGVYFFVNGMHQMVELATGGQVGMRQVRLFHTDFGAHRATYANGSQPITMTELDATVRDLSALVLIFDPRSRTFSRAQAATWQTPQAYTPETTAYLPWTGAPAPWLQIARDQTLELLLARDIDRRWVAVRFLRTSQTDLGVTWERNRLSLEPRQVAVPYWAVATFDAGGPPEPVRAEIRTGSEARLAGVWLFSPPSAYRPETSPFLSWWEWDDIFMNIEEPLLLPLDTRGCAPGCAVRLEYLAQPGRDFSVSVEGGPIRSIETAGEHGGWIEVLLPLAPGTAKTVVRIEPTGEAPVRLRKLERAKPSGA
jgi:hypothetical protein